MYAVIRTGGKQLRVAEHDQVVVERIVGELGSTVAFTDVLLVGEAGAPPVLSAEQLKSACVYGEVVSQSRGPKVLVFKKRRRKNSRRCRGHRQEQTIVRITGISPSGDPLAGRASKTPSMAEPEVAAGTGADVSDAQAGPAATEE